MLELMIEMLGYLIGALLIGMILGYLFWGWGRGRAIESARREGLTAARTSMDGDSALRTQLETSNRERALLEATVSRLNDRIAELQATGGRAGPRHPPAETMEAPLESPPSTNVTPLRLEPHMQMAAEEPEPATEIPRGVREAAPATHDDHEDTPVTRGIHEDTPVTRGVHEDTPEAEEPLARGRAERMDDTPRDPVDDLQASLNELAASRLGRRGEAERAEPEPDETEAHVETWSMPKPGAAPPEVPADADDLTMIDGMDEMTLRILHANGVYQFDQLAAFTANDFAWLETVADMSPGQIDQQAWIEQATQLQSQKMTTRDVEQQ